MAFPTDTVTGLGCLASSAAGVAALFALKGRSADKPLILFVGSLAEADRLAGGLGPRPRALLERCWPGPLTAILPLAGTWPDGVGRDGGAGFRIPDHPVARALVAAAGAPLATTSANRSGERPLARAEEAAAVWPGVAILPGASAGSVPSTVADLTTWPPRLVRAGALDAAGLAALARAAEAGSAVPPLTRRETP